MRWISQDEWRAMVRRSENLGLDLRRARALGHDTAAIMAELVPLRTAIRDEEGLKVTGIDDRRAV
jgi:hypothetical protein